MSKIEISIEEYENLIDSHKQLQALEHGGVDNWEGFDFAMDEYREIKREEEKLDSLVEDILEVCSEDVDINPAGPGTGVALMVDKRVLAKMISDWKKS